MLSAPGRGRYRARCSERLLPRRQSASPRAMTSNLVMTVWIPLPAWRAAPHSPSAPCGGFSG